MKKMMTILTAFMVIFFITFSTSHAEEITWEYVGEPGFSKGKAYQVTIDIDSSNRPYVAYRDYRDFNKPKVKKFNGESWVSVGNSDLSDVQVSFMTMGIDSSDNIFVASQEATGNQRFFLTMFDGVSWKKNYLDFYTLIKGPYFHINLLPNGNAYIAYLDISFSDRASVLEYNITTETWDYVGNPGFTDRMSIINFAVDNNDTPYVVCDNYTNYGPIQLMKFNGSEWEEINMDVFPIGKTERPYIKFDSKNNLHMAYFDTSQNESRLTVQKYDGVHWKTVGNPRFSSHGGWRPVIEFFGSLDTQYVAYIDSSGNGVSVMKLNDTTNSWDLVGNQKITSESVNEFSFAIDHFNTLYVAYQNRDNEDAITVKRFGSANYPTEITEDDFDSDDSDDIMPENDIAVLTEAIALRNSAIQILIYGIGPLQYDEKKPKRYAGQWKSINKAIENRNFENVYPRIKKMKTMIEKDKKISPEQKNNLLAQLEEIERIVPILRGNKLIVEEPETTGKETSSL